MRGWRGRGRPQGRTRGRSRSGRNAPPTEPSSQPARGSSASARVSHRSSSGPVVSSNHPAATRNDSEVEGDMDRSDETIMALDMKANGPLGCAVFRTESGHLSLLEENRISCLSDVKHLILLFQPTTILTPGRTSDELIEHLETASETLPGESQPPFILRLLPSSDFAYGPAKARLSCMLTEIGVGPGDPVTEGHENNDSEAISHLRLGSRINMDSRLSVGCSGAVTKEIHRRESLMSVSTIGFMVSFRVRFMDMFGLEDCMYVNTDTLFSLQVLRSENHPNGQGLGIEGHRTGMKESLSIYGLLNSLAGTPQGKSRLREVLLRPSTDLDLIRERQNTITVLLELENQETLDAMSRTLRGICNIHRTIEQLRRGSDCVGGKGCVDKGVWATLRRFANKCLELHKLLLCLRNRDNAKALAKILQAICIPELYSVGSAITRTIDFDKTKTSLRCVVRDGVDKALDELNRQYSGTDSLLDDIDEQLAMKVPARARQFLRGCVFIPLLGFLITISRDTGDNGEFQGEESDGRMWEKVFTSPSLNLDYYKNDAMRDSDSAFGDAYCMIIDREIELIHDLTSEVLLKEQALCASSNACAELDWAVALALGARTYGWVKPVMTGDNVLNIKGGRHALQELVVPSYIPNDCDAIGGGGREEVEDTTEIRREQNEPGIFVLTGPNHSGKSVYLKQLALIVYLSHIGSYVPAESAVVGLTDKILTRISSRESVGISESAFGLDLRQVSYIVNNSTRRSLVIVDEFGKGTRSDDGAGLMTGLLDHLLSRGPDMPRAFITTHFHEIFEDNYLGRIGESVLFYHMDVRLDRDVGDREDQIVYLYKLSRGRSLASFGVICASLAGVGAEIIKRAEKIAQLLSVGDDISAYLAKVTAAEEAHLNQAEQAARRFLEAEFSLESDGQPKLLLKKMLEYGLDQALS